MKTENKKGNKKRKLGTVQKVSKVVWVYVYIIV